MGCLFLVMVCMLFCIYKVIDSVSVGGQTILGAANVISLRVSLYGSILCDQEDNWISGGIVWHC